MCNGVADMIEISCRGKQKGNGEWVKGFYTITTIFGENVAYLAPVIHGIPKAVFDCASYEIIPETVGQFTGLYDSTTWEELTPEEQNAFLHQPDGWENTEDVWPGKEIYTGDIISYIAPDDLHAIGVVRFGNYGDTSLNVGFYVEWVKPFAAKWLRQDIRFWTIARETRIIGNIHDNPELLEG